MLIVAQLKPESYKKYIDEFLLAWFILLIYVLINPADGYLTSRWIDLGFLIFSPQN